jgi:predicted nuclease with TOPRIM domain
VNDTIGITELRLEKVEVKFTKLDSSSKTADKKKILEEITKDIEKANAEVKTLQYEIKKCPGQNQADLNRQLEKIRSDVSDLELRYKEKKKNVKFAINLADEKEALEEIDNKADMMDE